MLHALLHDPYPVIALVSLIEGAAIAIAAGVGFALGYIDPYFAFAIILAGVFVQDVVYYHLGRWAATQQRVRDFATRTKLLRENVLTLEAAWRKEMFLVLLLAKFAYGIYVPFVVSAGMSEAPFWKFIGLSMAISAPTIVMWMGVGYGMTHLYGSGGHDGAYIAAGVGVAGLAALFFVMRQARRHLNRRQAAQKSHVIDSDGPSQAKTAR
ncbi:MAG TPA: VTT domain-containing protein [Caulobacteraceae bacterium]|nr:VTT domain-containing protein [Caulobacteraceae bacterium]